MPELEELLRDEVRRTSDAYVPSAALPDRIHGRVAARERRRRAVAGVVAAATCLLVVAGVAAAVTLPGGAGDRDVETGPADSSGTVPSTTTTRAPTTATAPSVPTVPTTTAPPPPTGEGPGPTTAPGTTPDATSTTTEPTEGPAAITASTPLNRSGIGGIVAGMTVAEAEAETGNTITVDEPIDASSTCRTGAIDGLEPYLLMELPAGATDGQAVIRSVLSGVATAEGVAVGGTVADLRAAYGEPTDAHEYPYVEGGQVLAYEAEGYAYSATVDGAQVITELQSGMPEWVGIIEGGCV